MAWKFDIRVHDEIKFEKSFDTEEEAAAYSEWARGQSSFLGLDPNGWVEHCPDHWLQGAVEMEINEE